MAKTKEVDYEQASLFQAPTKSGQAAKIDFRKNFERLAYTQSYSSVFDDFLDFALYQLNIDKANDPNRERLDKKYKEEDGILFAKMFNDWAIATDNEGEGFYDVLGDLFMELLAKERIGQYFTPMPICDMMAQMTYGTSITEIAAPTVHDPAVGSGRMIMAIAKMNRNAKFFSADLDITCCKMTVLNMMANSMRGEVAWMNSLSMEHYGGWFIDRKRYDGKLLPFYIQLPKNVTSIKMGPDNPGFIFQEDIDRINSERSAKAMLGFLKELNVAADYKPVERQFYTVDQQYFAYLNQSNGKASV